MSDTDTNASADTELGEVTIEWTYDAPRELVFECMTTPEHLTHFWGPPGVSTPLDKITIELHVGGRFDTTMVNDENGEEYPTHGIYVEIDPPRRLAFSEPTVGGDTPMITAVDFVDLGDGRTKTVIHQTNVPPMYRSPEALEGFKGSLARFGEYVVTLV